MSAFGGKADMTFAGSPLSRSLLGVKRTSLFALHMSAFDPKRTCRFALQKSAFDPKRNTFLHHPTCSSYADDGDVTFVEH